MAHEWKPLPDDLAESHRRLIHQLRELKDNAGLSYTRLAHKTPYSRSSWARFLNGEQFPTRQAVAQLAHICHCDDPEHIERLWDLASHEAAPATETPSDPVGTAAPSAVEPTAAEAVPSPARRIRHLVPPRLVVVAVLSTLLGAAVATPLTLALDSDRTPRRSASVSANGPPPHRGRQTNTSTSSVTVRCQGEACYHKDPQAMRCDLHARTLRVTWNLGMRIELRYSPACHAGWGHITRAKPGDTVSVANQTGQHANAVVRTGHTKYTSMINASNPDALWACGHNPRRTNCTAH